MVSKVHRLVERSSRHHTRTGCSRRVFRAFHTSHRMKRQPDAPLLGSQAWKYTWRVPPCAVRCTHALSAAMRPQWHLGVALATSGFSLRGPASTQWETLAEKLGHVVDWRTGQAPPVHARQGAAHGQAPALPAAQRSAAQRLVSQDGVCQTRAGGVGCQVTPAHRRQQAAHLRKVRLMRVVPASGWGCTRSSLGTCGPRRHRVG